MERPLAKVTELLNFMKYRGTMKTTFTNMEELHKTSLETDQLVWVYAHWCGPCQRSKPAWENATKLIQSKNYPIKLQSVDGSIHSDVCKGLKTEGFPTFLLVSKRTNTENVLKCEKVDCRDEEGFKKKLLERYS